MLPVENQDLIQTHRRIWGYCLQQMYGAEVLVSPNLRNDIPTWV